MFESLMNKNFDDMSKETVEFRFDWFVKALSDNMDACKKLQDQVSDPDFFVMMPVEDLLTLKDTYDRFCGTIDFQLVVFAMFVLGIKDHIKFE